MGSPLHEFVLPANTFLAGLLSPLLAKFVRRALQNQAQLTAASTTSMEAFEKKMKEHVDDVAEAFNKRLDELKSDMQERFERVDRDYVREKGARHVYQQRLEDTRQEFGQAIARLGAFSDVAAAGSGEHPRLPPSGKQKSRP